MTVHDLHDALTLLPADLLTEADKVRTPPQKKRILRNPLISLAACLVLLLGLGVVVRKEVPLQHIVMQKDAAAEAPAAMAPAPMEQEMTAEEAVPEEPAAEAPVQDSTMTGAASGDSRKENGLCIDHSHVFAEETDRTVNSPGYCGNMTATVTINGAVCTLSGSDAVALTDILAWLDYDPDQVCRCMADITVDTELLSGIQVSLEQGFARCGKGQAALTAHQTDALRKIFDNLQ